MTCGADRAADQLAAAAEQRDWMRRQGRISRRALPWRAAPGATARAAATCRSCAPAPRAAACSTRASARSMLSPPSRMCSPTATRSSRSSPALLGDGNQGEVGRAAADVAHEHEIADAHAARQRRPAPRSTRRTPPAAPRAASRARGRRPRRHAPSARAPPRRTTQAPSAARPRPRGGPPDLVVPRVAQVTQVRRRGVHRRNLRHLLGRTPGQNRAAPVRRRRTTATTSRDATSRTGFSAPRLRASSPTIPDGASVVHGSARLPAGKSTSLGQVQERRQQRARRDLVRIHELRDLAHLD